MTTTRDQLKTDAKFVEWVATGQKLGYMFSLAELVDDEIGNTGYPNAQPHTAHINLGVQETVRRVRNLLRDPLNDNRRPTVPQARYGTTATTESE